MTFDSQKRAQTQTDVIEPRLAAAHLPAFDQTKLLDAAMILFDLPTERSIFDALKITQLNPARLFIFIKYLFSTA
jgi:hypothetical protein